MTKRASLFLLTNYQIDKLASYLINRLATILNYFQLLKVDSMQSLRGFSSEEPKSTCNQCYKHFTGLNLQVCKNRPILKINYSPMCCQIQYADACFHF